MKRITVLALALVASCGDDSYGGDCRPFFAGHHAARHAVAVQHVQHAIAVPAYPAVVNYFVGAPYRVEAALEYERRTDPQWQEFQSWKQGGSKPQSGVSVIQSRCVKCHNATTYEGELDLSGEITPEMGFAIIDAIQSDRMPKKSAPLSAAEKGAVLQELLSTIKRTPKASDLGK